MVSLEYLAGYFDGEGCVTVSAHSSRRAAGLRVQIQSGDKEVLDEFVARFGGEAKAGKVYPCNYPQKRALFTWNLNSTKAQNALHQMLPFLISKKIVAELALQMNFLPNGGQRIGLSQGEIENRMRIRKEISSINQRVTVN